MSDRGEGILTLRWPALALVTLAHSLSALSVLSVAPLSPFLLEAFHLSRAQVGFLLPAIYLGGVVMSLPAGWLTDRLGVRLTLLLGQGLTGVMIGVAALSQEFPTFLGFLFLGGLGWSVLNPATGKAVVEWFPARERGLAMGIKQTGLTLGGIAGALLPPLWRSLWAGGGGLAALGGARGGRRPDSVGSPR